MTDIIKISVIGITAVFLCAVVKRKSPEAAIAISLAAGTAIFFISIDALNEIIYFLNIIAQKANLDIKHIKIIIKIIGIAYLTHIGVSIANDAGESAIASKIEFGGQMCIVIVSAPILLSVFELIFSMVY